jgi:hypothetical protein
MDQINKIAKQAGFGYLISGEYTADNATFENGWTRISDVLPQQEEAGSTIRLDLKENK